MKPLVPSVGSRDLARPHLFAPDASRDELSAEVNVIRDIRDISNGGEAAHRARPRRPNSIGFGCVR
jgi:hypothetical protein